MFFPFFCIFCVFVFFCISVTTFEPIKIQTRSAPQNDRLNFSFVKVMYVVGKKNEQKWSQILGITLYNVGKYAERY